MNTFLQLDQNGFPLYLHGNRHTPSDLNQMTGENLIDAIERAMPRMLRYAQVGNAAGFSIVSATTRYEEGLFPPETQSITWGNLTNNDREMGGGVVTEVETTGLPLAHTKSTDPRKVVRLYFRGTSADVPGGIFRHQVRDRATV